MVEPQSEGILVLWDAPGKLPAHGSDGRGARSAGYRCFPGEDVPLSESEIFVAEPCVTVRLTIDHARASVDSALCEQYGRSRGQLERSMTATPIQQAWPARRVLLLAGELPCGFFACTK